MKRSFGLGTLFVLVLMTQLWHVTAQTALQCGDIIQDEFSQNDEARQFQIDLEPGDMLSLSAQAFGGSLKFGIIIQDSVGNVIARSKDASNTPALKSDVLGSSGTYFLSLFNGEYTNASLLGNGGESGANFYINGSGIGAFTFNIGCTRSDGKVIKPGDTPVVAESETPSLSPISVPTFGFPGLPPVDFANAFEFPLTLGTASVGKIPTVGDAILGFQFAANEGDKLDLSFKRTAGNLNLGLVVLSPDNKVAYMAALVTSDTMSTTFTLPSSGDYTIGIFRIDLVPPASPEATGFEILAAKG